MTWHTDGPLLAAYQAGDLRPAQAASVEAHLTACGPCRSSLAGMADTGRLARNWAAVADRIDDRPQPLLERLLVRMGVREHHARLIVTTPALRGPTAVGVLALVVAVAGLAAAGDAGDDGWLYAFLVLAPMLPLAGVAAAFGGRTDPVHELASVAPTPAFELLLARALAVVTATTVLSLLASIPLPHDGWATATWLLPALGLSAASLALSTWVPASTASAGLGVAWVTVAIVSWQVNRLDADVVGRFVALRPAGQVACAAMAAAGAVVLVLRRETLEFRRIP
jgi:hypothetical protein